MECSKEAFSASEPAHDNSFTGLLEQAKTAGLQFSKETDRLREVIRTLRVNAIRGGNPEYLVQWMADNLGDILNGTSLREAIDRKPAAPSTPAQAEPVAWIVTDGSGSRFRTWADGMPCWTFDREQAIRYARRADAEMAHAEDDDAWSILPYAHPPAPPQDREAVARCIAIVREVRDGFLSPDYATDQPVSSFSERFACDQVASAIENEFAMGTAEQRALLGAEERGEG